MQCSMSARAIVQVKEVHDDGSILQMVVWELARPVPRCTHTYKYRLYYGAAGVCRVR